MTAQLYVLAGALMVLLGACGDGDDGNEDTLLTGFSGVLIAAVVIWLVIRAINKHK